MRESSTFSSELTSAGYIIGGMINFKLDCLNAQEFSHSWDYEHFIVIQLSTSIILYTQAALECNFQRVSLLKVFTYGITFVSF